MNRNIQFILCAFVIITSNLIDLNSKESFFLDAVVFQSKEVDSARIDVYIVVPYESLTFENINDRFVANIDINIRVSDNANKTVGSKRVERTVIAEDYNSSQGSEADFLRLFYRFTLSSGTYTVNTEIKDEFSNNKLERKREVTVIEFDKFPFSLSGILLLSQIEEVEGKYKITPFISDNIGRLEDKFFAFFELYNQNEPRTIEVTYNLLKNGEVIAKGENKEINLPIGKSQNFLNVDVSELSLSGDYILQVIAYDKSRESEDKKVLAITQRSIKHDVSDISLFEKDIDNAIRMLRYVATESEIEKIENQKSEGLKREKFNAFWKELDPSPSTSFNEAKNEYYQRIKYANEQFKSYTEGWLTDMGMVFIVLGPPMQVDKQSSFGNNVEYRLWRYGSNRTFLFADKNGFGNFRLERPYLFNEKYRYKK